MCVPFEIHANSYKYTYNMKDNDSNTLTNIYKTLIVEAAPGNWEINVPTDEGLEDESPSEEMIGHSGTPVKFPGIKELQSSKFYLPYLKHFKTNYGEEEGAAFGEMIARFAKKKLDKEHGGNYTGTKVEFRKSFLSPLIQEIVNDLGVTKGVSELTSGYVARALTDAFIDVGYLKGEKLTQTDSAENASEQPKQGFEESKKHKPDYLDMDKDGNKKESMKKAIADKKKKHK